jgi:hypothetical protein
MKLLGTAVWPLFWQTPSTRRVQGRFWPKTWDSLALPASSRAKFEFSDGYPRV